MKPFLNIDAGELETEPVELYAVAHAVSVACGGHAGDPRSMERVLTACKAAGTRVGAHPSYDDREGFGRRELTVPVATVGRSVASQCAALAAVAREVGVPVTIVKPHGALYHAANRDPLLARAVAEAAREALGIIILVGPPDGWLVRAAGDAGLGYAREGFADRAMRSDGSLVPRGEPGAVITDVEVARAQARLLARSDAVDTLCVHGDTAGALVLARAVRAELDALP